MRTPNLAISFVDSPSLRTMILWCIGGDDAAEEAQDDGIERSVRVPLEQIINLKHELVLLAGKIDWDWIDREIAPLYSENGRSGWQATARPIGMARKRIAARALIRQCRGSMDRRSYPLIANSHPFPSSDPDCTVLAGDERLGRRVP